MEQLKSEVLGLSRVIILRARCFVCKLRDAADGGRKVGGDSRKKIVWSFFYQLTLTNFQVDCIWIKEKGVFIDMHNLSIHNIL